MNELQIILLGSTVSVTYLLLGLCVATGEDLESVLNTVFERIAR